MSANIIEKLISDMLDTDPDLRDIENTFRVLLSGMDDDLVKEVTNQCMQTIAVYEYVLSLGNCEDLWKTFLNTLKSCDNNKDNSINPREYVNDYKFKLKCIVTVQEIYRGNYKTLAEAVYTACNSEEYKEVEKLIGDAREIIKKYKVKPNYSSGFCWPFQAAKGICSPLDFLNLTVYYPETLL